MDEQPSDLLFIQRCVREGRLFWTYHANIRLRQRAVDRHMVTESVASYEILEQYPESQASRYLPVAWFMPDMRRTSSTYCSH